MSVPVAVIGFGAPDTVALTMIALFEQPTKVKSRRTMPEDLLMIIASNGLSLLHVILAGPETVMSCLLLIASLELTVNDPDKIGRAHV